MRLGRIGKIIKKIFEDSGEQDLKPVLVPVPVESRERR